MIEENWLSDVLFTTVEIKADLTKVGTGANGDFQTAALSRAVNTDETNELVIQTWFTRCRRATPPSSSASTSAMSRISHRSFENTVSTPNS